MNIKIVLAVCLSLFAAGNSMSADLTADYVVKPVRVGAGGWMRGLILDPAEPTRRYARSDVFGAFRWDAAANEWQQMAKVSTMPARFGRYPSNAPSVGLAMSASDRNVVLMALDVRHEDDVPVADQIDRIRVYRSTNAGVSFAQEGDLNINAGGEAEEERGERLVIDPNNGNIAYFASIKQGLWRSQNGGLNWTNIVQPGLSANTATRFVRFDATAGTTVVAGQAVSARQYLTYVDGSIFQSLNGGQSYTLMTGGAAGRAGTVIVNGNGDLYVGDRAGSALLWRKQRDGSWTQTVLANGNLIGIALDPNSTNRLFVSHQDGGLTRVNIQNGAVIPTYLGGTMRVTQSPIAWLLPDPIRRPLASRRAMGGIAMDNTGKLWQSVGNDGIVTTMPNDATNSEANPPNWQVQAQGIEQMVGTHALIPPGQKPLLSFLDETSFLIDNPDQFTAVPYNISTWVPSIPNAGGFGFGLSSSGNAAYCPNATSYIVNTTANTLVTDTRLNANKYAGFSTNGGRSFTLFSSIINNTHPSALIGGTIAVSARALGDGVADTTLVWLPTKHNGNVDSGDRGTAPYYSSNGGQSWAQTSSFAALPGAAVIDGVRRLPSAWGNWNIGLTQQLLLADPLIKDRFYLHIDSNSNSDPGHFYASIDGGTTWQRQAGGAQLPLNAWNAQMVANPNASGDLWFVDGWGGFKTLANGGADKRGLWRTSNGGQSFSYFPGFEYTLSVSLGKASSPGNYPTIYVAGKRTSGWGIYRSINQGQSWDQISKDPLDSNDRIASIAASQDEFGLVYTSFRGSSAAYLRPKQAAVNIGGVRPAQNTVIAIKAQVSGSVIAAESAGNAPLVANRTAASIWEQFTLDVNAAGEVALKASANGLFVCAENFGNSPLIANRTAALGSWERFDWLDQGDGTFVLRAKANGRFIQVQSNQTLVASADAIASATKFVRIQP